MSFDAGGPRQRPAVRGTGDDTIRRRRSTRSTRATVSTRCDTPRHERRHGLQLRWATIISRADRPNPWSINFWNDHGRHESQSGVLLRARADGDFMAVRGSGTGAHTMVTWRPSCLTCSRACRSGGDQRVVNELPPATPLHDELQDRRVDAQQCAGVYKVGADGIDLHVDYRSRQHAQRGAWRDDRQPGHTGNNEHIGSS